jgi:gliding motility-associated-like protein
LKKLYYLLLCIVFSAPSFGGGLRKATFASNDLFQTGYFLKNVPGLITDYNGQPIRYFADHDGVCVFLTDAGPVYKLIKADEKAKKEIYEERDREKKLEIENDGARENVEDENPRIPTFISYTTVHWIGANPRPLIEASGKNTGTYNYLAGTSPKDFHSIVTEGFKKIVYHDMYPGIDVEYTFPDKGGIEYDLIVHPGADARVIKMEYGGAARSIEAEANGNMTIHTETGDILEHAPVSHSADGRSVASAFDVHGTQVSFSLPAGYDHSSTLTIDPWVNVLTQLTVQNLGADVDYDVPGNLYIYGAGGSSSLDVNAGDYEKVAKFSAAGTFLWVFNGSVPSVGWTTTGGMTVDFLSNMKVDRILETVYIGCAFDYPNGTQVIRLDNNGVYNNFISNRNASFTEVWSFVQNCATGAIIPMGGGITGNLNLAVITPTTGAVAINNFTGIPYTTSGGGFFSSSTTSGFGQDVVSGAEDSLENLFVVMASLVGTPSINNTMYQVNSTYNGKVWGPVGTGFTTFTEANNMPQYDPNPNNENSNNYNALAVNMSYLYYYDGTNLAAYNKANGARVGTAITVTGANPLYQGGIAVDRCNNIYVGQVGQILTYTFNGATFTQGVPISLGPGFTSDAVMDVRYNQLNNLLYVTGVGFAGTYVAVPSRTCIVGLPYTDTLKIISLVSAPCSYPEAVINVTPGQTIPFNPQFTYVWQDSLGNILQQHGPGAALTDTFAPTHTGKYTIQVELNENCGLNSDLTTFYINSRDSLTPSPADTTLCPNQPVTLTAIPCAPGGTYLWTPGGATTSSITVTPGSSTNYIVTYTPLSGQGSPITDTIPVTVVTAVTLTVNSDTVCNGQPATLTATPSLPGGSYSWTPGGATTQSITVTTAANSITTYTVTYTTLHCGTATATGTITTGPNAGPDQTITCYPTSNTVTMGATGAGTWTPSAGNTGTATITNPSSPTTTITGFSGLGTYNFVWTVGACTDTAAVFVTNTPLVIDSTIQNDSCYGYNDGQISLVVTPPSANYTYTWSNSGSTTDTITGLAPGAYSVTVTNPSTGCTATGGPYTITSPGPDSLSITPQDTMIALGDTIQLNSTVMGGFPAGTYSWTPANGLSCTNCPDPILVPTVADTFITPYILTFTYNNGCVVSDTAYIQAKAFNLLAIPDAFTPNGDNVNDTFKILALSVLDFRLTIYNRWGGLLFESTDINNGWDGTYMGKPQPGGTYLFFFTVTHLNGKTESNEGSLTLLR